MGRAAGNGKNRVCLQRWCQQRDTSMRWYDRSRNAWSHQPLAPGSYRHSMIELSGKDGSSRLIYLPKVYRTHENRVLEYLPDFDGCLNVTEALDGWQLELTAELPDSGCVADYTMVSADAPLLNWEHSFCGELWKNYTMETEGKWCFDGYYWPCPDNYVPTGENYLYPNPAAYLLKSFSYAAQAHSAAADLALAMLDVMSQSQNEQGFWPTAPRSTWLYDDYGIDGGYYDTRFNTDLVEIYGHYYNQFGGDTLRRSMEQYVSFYTDFAQTQHFETERGGWLIPDYGSDTVVYTPHCSLNHQLAECIELYRLAETLSQPELAALADRLLLAIEDTGSR